MNRRDKTVLAYSLSSACVSSVSASGLGAGSSVFSSSGASASLGSSTVSSGDSVVSAGASVLSAGVSVSSRGATSTGVSSAGFSLGSGAVERLFSGVLTAFFLAGLEATQSGSFTD